MLKSSQPIMGRYGTPQHVLLLIRCKENETELYFHFADDFMRDIQGGSEITYRLDKLPAGKGYFSESTNHESLFARAAIPFIKTLLGHERLFIRATPYNDNNIQAEFEIAGLGDAIKPLREACRW
jgi:type VI secretion system protein VasI